jgi:hypothetical protein
MERDGVDRGGGMTDILYEDRYGEIRKYHLHVAGATVTEPIKFV